MAMIAVGTTAYNLVDITPDPSELQYGLQDISDADAGRVHDAGNRMYKMRTSQKRKLNMSWSQLTREQVGVILRAFNPEYIFIRYYDLLDSQFEVREFYVGDRTAPYQYYQIPGLGTRITTLSFDAIEV